MIVIGLTGSIGMGKSTTAKMFVESGVPVHDSDEAVHRIYASEASSLIETAFPGMVKNGVVDRTELSSYVLNNDEALQKLKDIVHPLVLTDANIFLKRCRAAGVPIALLDIPLLFETDGCSRVDQVVVVTAPANVQRERVLARIGMTKQKFEALLAKQIPDAEKRKIADYIVDTDQGLESARAAVQAIVTDLAMRKP